MPNKETVQMEMPAKMIVIQHASCPRGHDLMNPDHKIHGHAAVTVKVKYKDREGMIHLDPVYGSYDNESDIEIPKDGVAEFFCPECGISLVDPDQSCNLCSAPMFAFMLPNHGIIEGCSRQGCRFHHLKIVTSDELMDRLNDEHILDSYL
ncbi:hypothetical protein GF407_15500 [candidate division KSB1 bacterium]|nr:hypothetical protein [candidate division KSB1 bacterium]